jgi:hypothetical protein
MLCVPVPGDDDPSGRVPTDLARAIGEQLEQAGLFKHLEPIFEQIQTQLTAAMPSVAVLQELAGEGPASRSHGSKGKEETMTVLQYTQQVAADTQGRKGVVCGGGEGWRALLYANKVWCLSASSASM